MDVKTYLKEAREAIDKKDYNRALEICTDSLTYFPSNFNINLFTGLCHYNLGRMQDSERAYQAALALTPASPLPMRGLMEVYTRSGESDKLIKVVTDLIPLTPDAPKKRDLQIKLIDLYVVANRHQDVARMVRDQLSETEEPADRIKLLVRLEDVVRLESQAAIKVAVEDRMKARGIPILNPLKAKVIGAPTHTPAQRLEKESMEADEASKSAMKADQLLAMLDEDGADLGSLLGISQMLVRMHPERALGWIGLGAHLVNNEGDSGDNARAMLEHGLLTHSTSVLGQVSLVRATLASRNYPRTIELVARSLQVISAKPNADKLHAQARIDLHIMHAEALLAQWDVETAIKVLENSSTTPNARVLMRLGHAHFDHLQNLTKAATYFEQAIQCNAGHDAQLMLAWIRLKQDGKAAPKPSVSGTEGTYLAQYLDGLHHLLNTRDSEAIADLLKAAHSNQTFAPTFAALGVAYGRAGQTDRSRKCLQKALALDVMDVQAGKTLSDDYVASKQFALSFALHREITNAVLVNRKRLPYVVGRCAWAFYRLALYEMDVGRLEACASNLLMALKGVPDDAAYWRALGECYRRQTKHIAALKALRKADALLGSKDEHPELHFAIATIARTLGLADDAVAAFDAVLRALPSHVPALKGRAECHLTRARDLASKHCARMAVEALTDAETSITKATTADKGMVSLWKLKGDIATTFHTIFGDDTNVDQKLKDGAQAYIEALALKPGESGLLHDLALNHHLQAVRARVSGATTEVLDALLKTSIKAACQAINAAPSDARMWNMLGIVLMDSHPSHSQHAFVRAAQLDSTAVMPFNNLASLYMATNNLDLAQSALLIGKANDPTSSSIWSLQGLLHEVKDGQDEALAEYSHISIALESCACGEALLGYATLAFKRNDYATAELMVVRYLTEFPQSADGHNLLGLVAECNGQLERAVEYLTKALSLSPPLYYPGKGTVGHLGNATESATASSTKLVTLNLSRVLLKLGKYADCLATLAPHLNDAPCPIGSVILEIAAIASLKDDNQKDAFVALYQRAVAAVAADDQPRKKSLLLGLARALYAAGLKDKSAAVVDKVLATDQSDGPKQLRAAMLAASGDLKGATAALSGTQSLDSLLLSAGIATSCNQIPEARSYLIQACHTYPFEERAWVELARHLLANDSLLSAQVVASLLSRVNASPNVQIESDIARMHMVQPTRPTCESTDLAINHIKRLIHRDPLDNNAYKILSNLLYVRAIQVGTEEACDAAQASLEIVKTLAQGDQEKEFRVQLYQAGLLLIRGDKAFTAAIDVLSKQKQADRLAHVHALSARWAARNGDATGAISSYKLAITQAPSNVNFFHELAHVYEDANQMEAANLCLVKALEISTTTQDRFMSTLRLSRQLCITKKLKEASKKADDALEIAQSHPVALLLRGLVSIIASQEKKMNKQVEAELQAAYATLTQALSCNPRTVLANLYSAIAYMKVKPSDVKAIETLLKSEQTLSPSLQSEVTRQLATLKELSQQ
eukprot:gene9178-10769_t